MVSAVAGGHKVGQLDKARSAGDSEDDVLRRLQQSLLVHDSHRKAIGKSNSKHNAD
jgi:hypothetical protein